MVRTRAMSLREENEPEILVAHDSNEVGNILSILNNFTFKLK